MNSKATFVTGIVAGTMVGVGATMLINPLDEKDKKRIAKNTSHMFTAMGQMADRVVDMYR
jgi:gas vesicle protein